MFNRLIPKISQWEVTKAQSKVFVFIAVVIFLWLAFQPCPGCGPGIPGNY